MPKPSDQVAATYSRLVNAQAEYEKATEDHAQRMAREKRKAEEAKRAAADKERRALAAAEVRRTAPIRAQVFARFREQFDAAFAAATAAPDSQLAVQKLHEAAATLKDAAAHMTFGGGDVYGAFFKRDQADPCAEAGS